MSNNIILDPCAPDGAGMQRPWQSIDSLKDKVVAFIDNSKPNFNHLVDDLAELLISRHGAARVIKRRKSSASIPADAAVIAALSGECDVVIAGSGD